MKKNVLKWFVALLLCFVISTFLHEVGHGLSSYAVGVNVSTGFNRVGQVYKKPHDPDFRKGLENYENPWDMGPNTTLLLAIAFTLALIKISKNNKANKSIIIIVGAFALTNSMIRLIPMVHSYIGYLLKGSPYMEDEIGTGLIWYNLSGLELMKYMPSLISIVISIVCLVLVVKTIKRKLPELFSKRVYFASILVLAYVLSFIIENSLDNFLRINWI